MMFNLRRAVAFIMVVIAWILLTFFFIGCASVDKVQEKEGWFPVGMDEDNQSFYNSKYNMMDNGQDDPNANVKVFRKEF
jgi:hypothetical protein